MFRHIFLYKIRYMLGDRMGTFWLVAFPLVMSMFFYLSFPSMASDSFARIPLAVVGEDVAFTEAAEASELFTLHTVSMEDAEQMFDDEAVDGIVEVGSAMTLTVKSNGQTETIAKFFLDTYQQRAHTATTILTKSDSSAAPELYQKLGETKTYLAPQNLGGSDDPTLIFFYGLIGMAVIMASTMGIDNIATLQANQSHGAARNNVAPVRKLTTFSATTLASVLFHFLSILLLLAVLRYGYGLDLGDHPVAILLFCLLGCVSTILFGSAVSVLLRCGPNPKVAFLITYTMLGTTCSGMMSTQVRFMVNDKLPFVQYISLPSLVADGFYGMYYNDSLELLLRNSAILGGIGLLCLFITVAVLRKQSYKSL